mgnify:FL=1
MARKVFRTWEDYFIPGTSVLRNKFTTPGNPYGEPDAVKLRLLEEGYASSRILELVQTPIEGNFDYAHMKAIHHHIFQDIYEWAGQERVAPLGTFMVKSGPDIVHYPLGDPAAPQMSYQYYPAGPVLGQAANEQYRRLSKMDLLRGLDHETFVTELAEIWGELNVIHSFREGNTRTQFVFFSQLSEQAGWKLDPALFAPGTPGRDEFVAARFYSQATGSNQRLAAALRPAIVSLEQGRKLKPKTLITKSDLVTKIEQRGKEAAANHKKETQQTIRRHKIR